MAVSQGMEGDDVGKDKRIDNEAEDHMEQAEVEEEAAGEKHRVNSVREWALDPCPCPENIKAPLEVAAPEVKCAQLGEQQAMRSPLLKRHTARSSIETSLLTAAIQGMERAQSGKE